MAGAGLAAQLLVGRRILADLAAGGADVATVAPDLAVLAAVSAVVAVANLARAEQQRLLSGRVARYAAGRVLEVASAVELIAFERPELSDRLQRARVNAQIRPVQVASGVLGVLGGMLAALGAAGALLVLAPALLAAVVAAYAPVWWGTTRGSRLLHDFEVVHTERDRRRSYLFGLLSRREEAAEVRSFGLATHLGDHHTRLYDERIAPLGQVLRRRLRLAVAGQLISSALAAAALGALVWQVTTGRVGVAAGAAAAGAMVVLGSRLGGLVSGARQLYEASLFLEDLTGFVGPAPLGAPGAARGEHAPRGPRRCGSRVRPSGARAAANRASAVPAWRRTPGRSSPSWARAVRGGRPWPRCRPVRPRPRGPALGRRRHLHVRACCAAPFGRGDLSGLREVPAQRHREHRPRSPGARRRRRQRARRGGGGGGGRPRPAQGAGGGLRHAARAGAPGRDRPGGRAMAAGRSGPPGCSGTARS